MDNLESTIILSKSVLVPCTKIVFLGFVLCSTSMTVRLTPEKCQDIISLCTQMLNTKRTIRIFAKVIGKLTAAEPGVKHARLYTKLFETIKDKELRNHRGSFMNMPHNLDSILQWCIDNLPLCYRNIILSAPNITIYTDASLKMYGAYEATNNVKTRGFWSMEEQQLHINLLEMKACEIGLQTFCKNVTHAHVRIYTDNTTSCAYINKYARKIPLLDIISRRIWFWCIESNIHLSSSHIDGTLNRQADQLSRTGNDCWQNTQTCT